jgi:MFS family permease
VSFAAPFRQSAFAVIWTATVVSNVGGWMYSTAAGWLMTSLNPDPFIVAMVQAADTLPIFLFALPAGVLADIFDKRKFLIEVPDANVMAPLTIAPGPNPVSRR